VVKSGHACHRDATEINASPEAVFALVSRVESFVDYAGAVKAIERLDTDRYLWHVRIAGFSLKFDIEVTESLPPERFAWRSLNGISNRGCYRLTPTTEGTRIHLSLEYHLNNRLLEKAVNRVAVALVDKLSSEVIGKLKARLKAEANSHPVN
jgi:uncharacterized membrane protein